MAKLNRLEPLVDVPITMQNVMYISDESSESGEKELPPWMAGKKKKKKKSSKKSKKKTKGGY